MKPSYHVTLDDLSLEAFRAVSISEKHLDWVRIGFSSGIMHVTYMLDERRLETIGLDMGIKRFANLERRWSIAPFVIKSEEATYFGEGWRRTHQLDRNPTRVELLRELTLNSTPDTRITAHYKEVPGEVTRPKGAYASRVAER